MGRLLWNQSEKRIRAGWRVFLHLLIWVGIQLFASGVVNSAAATALAQLLPGLEPILDTLLFALLNLLLVVSLTLAMARHVDRRSISTLGLQLDRSWWLDLGFGLALGALLMTFIFLVERLLGWVTVVGFLQTDLPEHPFALMIWQPVVLFLVVGINEELLSRGYQLRNLAEGFATPKQQRSALLGAWVCSSILFGLLHIFNPNSSWTSTLSLMLVGGFWGLGFLVTGRLGIPIGLHITWNFFQGNIYGFPVSGNKLSTTTVLQIQQQGPPLWTGGDFGPEAGLLGLLTILLGALLIRWWVRWRYGEVRLQLALTEYPARTGLGESSSHENQCMETSKSRHQ